MEIKNFGAKKFGSEIVAFDVLENLSNIDCYDFIVVEKKIPDGNGNGSFTVSIINSNQQQLSLPNGWSIKEIRGGWNWNPYWVVLNLTDKYDIDIKVTIYDRNSPGADERVLINALEKLLYISNEFDNSYELDLVENNHVLSELKTYDSNGSLQAFQNYRKFIKQYWDSYQQYIQNPVYQRNVKDKHKDIITKNVFNIVNNLLQFEIVEQ